MTTEHQKHIQNIRDDFQQANPRLKDSLNHSIETLAYDLYNKDTHFIYELIQNAEDNNYREVEPTLSFWLTKADPTNTPGSNGALIVQNNEIGFSFENVDALCNVGNTSKKKAQGYIGEKGIGFKSVFRVTSTPYIFSNGFNFCLPEKDPETGFGFIVPKWIVNFPGNVEPNQTTIILPLDKPNYGYDDIEKMLLDIKPETILFLSKLKILKIKTDSGDDLSISKKDSIAPLVQVSITGEWHEESLSRVKDYLLYTRSFDRPDNIFEEKRKDIVTRNVSIAFTLNLKEENEGNVFAYLPLGLNSGLPFLINADFILPSSREDIQRDNLWNQWLRECITQTFVEAFVNWVDIAEYQTQIFAFIPLQSHIDFFNSVVSGIQNKLKSIEIVPTEPDGQKVTPNRARRAYNNFRELLSSALYPKPLLETRLVLSEIEIYKKQLEVIGVEIIKLDLVKACFMEKEWFPHNDLDWILKCYNYFYKQDISGAINLLGCSIVPIESEDAFVWSCTSEQQIYFEYDCEYDARLDSAPDCLKVKLAFVSRQFFEKIKNEENKLIKWMTDNLKIYGFSRKNYGYDVYEWLMNNFRTLSDSDFVSVTIFLASFVELNFELIYFEEIPVILSDGSRKPLSEVEALRNIQVVASPEALNPDTGWQNVFITEEDRGHIAWLSDSYINSARSSEDIATLREFWRKLGITEYPSPWFTQQNIYSLNDYEKSCANKSSHSTRNKKVSNYRPVSWLKTAGSMEEAVLFKRSVSLINWLSNQENLSWTQTTVETFYYSQSHNYFDSEFLISLRTTSWMPTTKGFVRPGQAYISSTNVKEVLGDTVPYIENNLLNQTIINLLKIRQQVTVEDLISILKQYSLSGEGSSDFAERVYRSLASRDISATMLGDLKQNNIIFIPTNPETKWVSRNSVIWRDRSDILGDDFIYLEKYYPKLKDFFIDKVQIKEDIDTETFANQWLKLQDTPIIDVKEIETALTVIYQEIQAILPFDNDPPNWWQDFKNKAKIWTQNKIFMQSDKVFVPDAPELKQIFKGPSVNFAWRPEKDSFSKWEELYRAFDLPYLSESVNISLSETDKYENNPSPLFLTTPSKILIATWIKEVRSLDYQRLLESKTLDAFFETTEACVSSLTLIYRLDNKDVTRTSDVFWNKKEYVLLVSKSQNGKAKNAIAGVLARDLMPNRAYKELMDWIELVLGEVDETWRLQQKNWRIPDELKKWLENDDRDLSSEPDYSSKDRISSENLPDEYIQENSEEEPFDYLAELEKSLNKNGATQIKNEQEPIDRSVHNAERRREKEFIAQKERISSEPYSEDRRRKTERTILEGPDKMVRETLQEWYGGKCQICGNTFPERDGQPFFVANYLVQRKLARQVDSYANALCLCADHFAKWQHGTIEAEEIIDQINSLKLVSEGGDGNLRLKIRLCGEECFITFNEKHVIAFQELQNVYKQVDVSDTEG